MLLEARLYEAYRRGAGMRLTPDDVQNLVGPDNAIRTRIVNAIAGWDVGTDFSEAAKMETLLELKSRLDQLRQ